MAHLQWLEEPVALVVVENSDIVEIVVAHIDVDNIVAEA